ncbi:MAG TPA: DUF1491 family protein [Sphingomicrobium sp.]|nr:DUF1491 family protein [Sphingomicrobium sp.]
MSERLPAHVEASAIIRRAESGGGFAAVLKRGDRDRGALMLVLRERGAFHSLLERELGPDFDYRWVARRAAEGFGSEKADELVAARRRFDADSWLIELDIAEPERFIAETTASG